MSRPHDREDDLVPTELSPTAQDSQTAPARAALGRYRVMAYVTGGWLLLLTLELVLKYVVDVNGGHRPVLGVRVAMVLAGVVPFMSFVLERRVHRDAVAELGDLGSRTTVAP